MKIILSYLMTFVLIVGTMSNTVFASDDSVYVSIESGMVGNIFFDAKQATFDVTYGNSGEIEKAIGVSYKTYKIGYDMQRESNSVYEFEKEYVIPALSDISVNFTTPLSGYGIYVLEATVTDSFGDVIGVYNIQFSNVVRNTMQSETLGINTGLSARGDAGPVLYLVKNAGMKNVRASFEWIYYEKSVGRYKLNERLKKLFETAEKYGIDVLTNINVTANVYDKSAQNFLRESEVEEYKNFINNFLNEDVVKNTVTKLEIMNEPYLKNKVDGEVVGTDDEGHQKRAIAYARMVKATDDVIESITDKEYKTGICTTGVIIDSEKRMADYMLRELESGDFDAYSLHPYLMLSRGRVPEAALDYVDLRSLADYYKKLVNGDTKGLATGNTYKFGAEIPIWHTELGYSSATGDDNMEMSTGDEFDQAKLVIRAINQLKLNNVDDMTYIYEMFDRGLDSAEREDNFGMVKSQNYEYPYQAKFGYLAVSNYNSLTMNATSCKNIVESNGKYITEYKLDNRNTYLLRSLNDGVTLKYDFGTDDVYYYDILGNKLNESDVMKDGNYVLSSTPFYAVTGTDITRAEPVTATAEEVLDEGEFVIKGRIPSGSENSRVSLIVTESDVEYNGTGFVEAIKYIEQGITDKDGTFEFNAMIPGSEEITAYIVSDKGELVSVTIGAVADESSIKVSSDGVDIRKLEFKNINFANLNVDADLTDAGDTSYKLICALYNGNVLKDVKVLSNGSVTYNDAHLNENVSFATTASECDEMKVMIFKDDGSISPLCEAYIKTN